MSEKKHLVDYSKLWHPQRRSRSRLILVAFYVGVLLFFGCAKENSLPMAVDGVIDLTDWDFKTKGNVALVGQWEFYWNQLLTPDDFQTNNHFIRTGFITMPSLWKGTIINETPILAQGYATYRLKVKIPPDTKLKSLVTKGALSVCRIWVNGELVATSGEIGTNKISEKPVRHITMPYFRSLEGEVELVLQISNFHNIQGGLNSPIWFGNADQIQHMMFRTWVRASFLGGIFLIMGLYHLVLYALRHQDRENLYFGTYCLTYSTATLFTDSGGCLINTLIPSLPWSASMTVTLISYGLMNPLIIMFYHSLFVRKRSPVVIGFYQVTSVLFITYLLITPPNAYGPVVALHRLITLGVIPYLIIELLIDLNRKEKGARFLIPGYLFLTFSFFNDKLLDLNLLDTVVLSPYGATAFLLSYSLLISIRSSRAFSTVEDLSQDLKSKNIRLKEAVQTLKENTHLKIQLEEQKQKEAVAKIEAERSSLETLRYQLNPHFLFNALTSIRGAIVRDGTVAREMVANLSEFCRLTLSSGKEERMAVRQEFELVGLYLEIEQTRLGDYLKVSTSVDPAVEELQLPPFLLQPLVENAVKYGKLTSPEQLQISISATYNGERLRLEVANTGNWVEPGTDLVQKSTGIGLDNLQKRLKKLYQSNYRFSYETSSGEVRVIIEIPPEVKNSA